MFRFWSHETRGSDSISDQPVSLSDLSASDCDLTSAFPAAARPPKRRRPSLVDTTAHLVASAKRAKTEENAQLPSPTSASAEEEDMTELSQDLPLASAVDRATEAIRYQFGLEILLKHDELRLINQELGKCQVALEQLRRCHLIPYPVNCPTPQQMLEISSGSGAALQSRPGQRVPRWAPPFGVVEGPYARHYAKWLIPDPKFDGFALEFQGFGDPRYAKSGAAEGRTTRNSTDMGGSGKRPGRGLSGHKLHALSSGYPQPKDKQSPCILKRADGQTVKLVCIDCHRWDFSSTQGFINHCRIAHRRDFKSHEEAAVHCGHPIEVDDAGGMVPEDKAPSAASTAAPPTSGGLVHLFARDEPITEHQAYASLRSRIADSVALYNAGRHPGVKPSSKPSCPSADFKGSSQVPHLSSYMQKKRFKGDLSESVEDAKIKLDLMELLTPGDDSEDTDQAQATSPKSLPATTARTPVTMRVPARTAVSPPPHPSLPTPPTATKSRVPAPQLGLSTISNLSSSLTERGDVETPMYDDEMEVDMSPNTMASNNAPSLVSDDGEYDDSDDGSSSDTSESLDGASVSDVAEINIDEDDITPGSIRHRGSTSVKLKKDESKHVTFVTPTPPISSTKKGRKKQPKA